MGKINSSDRQRPIDTVFDWMGNLMPKCEIALDLAETGIERKLSPIEHLSLKYHSNLCLYCSCKRGKLEALLKEMKGADDR